MFKAGTQNYDWIKHHRPMVDAWENRHNLIVEGDLIADFSMRYDYDMWYDSITRRFISPIETQQIDYGYQPGDAYFRRVVRDETSMIRNFFGGLSVDDQPRDALIEAIKSTMKTVDMLYEMSSRTPEQHHHHTRSTNRRRRQRVDDADDEPSFSTPDWRQITGTQSPTTTGRLHTSHGEGSSRDMTTQSPTTPMWPLMSHGKGPSQSTTTQSPLTPVWPYMPYGEGPSHMMTTQSPSNNVWSQMTHGEGSSRQNVVSRAPYDNFYVPSSYNQWPTQTPNVFQTPEQTYDPLFKELLLDEHRREDYNISPISYMGYSIPQSSSHVPTEVRPEDNEDDEEDEVESPPMVRRSSCVPKECDCGTGHRLYRK